MTKRIAFKTLGCRLNQFETDAIVTDFHKAGYTIVPYAEEADAYIVNTCTVTNSSDHKSKNVINQSVKKNNDALIVVTGCMTSSQKDWLENKSGITYVVENDRKSSLFTLVDAHFKGEMLHPSDLRQHLFDFTPVEAGFHTRSMIKIQDGCDNFCTFCIVPHVRGRAVSRPAGEILDNIRQIIDLGYNEMVLTGVNISRYTDGDCNFESLIEKILLIGGDFRIRISSIEPEGFGEKFIDLFSHPKLCPHLHLCLQSGSDRILMQMRRQYTISQYMIIVDAIRRRYEDFNFTTDIITGFPGETEADFSETCDVVREVGFSHIHTFKYSVRSGTRAERMENHISEKEKQARSEIIRKISHQNRVWYLSRFVGREQTVLVENITKGLAKGYGEHYIPVSFPFTGAKNNFANVTLKELDDTRELILLGT